MKSVETIYESLLASYAERAGFVPYEGCDLAVRLWAVAAQLQALDMQADWVLEQSFPQTAQGVYLDYHGELRGLKRIPAKKAAGTLRFSVESALAMDVLISAGTACMTMDGVRFQTLRDSVLEMGQVFVDVPAEAVDSGENGNVIAGTVCILTACPVAVTGCTNPTAFSGGYGAEDDETFRARILDSYHRLSNGTNTAWYEQIAENYPGVAAAAVEGRARGVGTVDVYVTEEIGLPSKALLDGLQAELQKKREIAVDVMVKAPETVPVDVTLTVAPEEGYSFADVKDAVEKELRAFFCGRLLGKPVLLAELGSRIYHLAGVKNYKISRPASDFQGDLTVLPVLSGLSIAQMEA